MIPARVLNQVEPNCTEGLGLALADPEDGAVLHFHWCNQRFCEIIGYDRHEVEGSRGTILIGKDMDHAVHLLIIERLMTWSQFSVATTTNKKDGTAFQIEMIWQPLSDHETGARWWLCSLRKPINTSDPTNETEPKVAGPFVTPPEEVTLENGRLKRENKRLKRLSQVVARASTRDSLTGLSNRRHFESELRNWLLRSKETGKDFAVVYVDLDHFKLINDNFGHDSGDQILVSAAETLLEICASDDFIARIGGDEFVIFRELTDRALDISNLADKIITAFSEPQEFDGKAAIVSASVGVSLASSGSDDPEEIVRQADTALFQSKESGRGTWSFFTEKMHSKRRRDKRLASDLLFACDRSEFFPLFQPIVNSKTGEISFAEVLIRWRHPEKGVLAPSEFLEIANTIGLISRVEQVFFDKVCECVERTALFEQGLPRISLNVSASRLCDPSFVHEIASSCISPNHLTIEILESTYLDQPNPALLKSIVDLRQLGALIAVDDFGTGHASLQGLLQLKPDLMKIDRQFIMPLLKCQRHAKLLEPIVSIAKTLQIQIVAEGIESAGHAFLADRLGCEFLQGYHFGKPMNCEQLVAIVAQKAENVLASATRA